MKEKLRKQVGKLSFLSILLIGGVDAILQIRLRSSGWGIENRGISFGVFQGVEEVVLLLVWMLLIFVLMQSKGRGIRSSLPIWMMVVGGGVNLLIRMINGGVWDYIRLPLVGLWFNISDMMITSGLGLLIFFKHEPKD